MQLGSFIMPDLWLVQALPCFGFFSSSASESRARVLCVVWSGSARAVPVVGWHNPVSLATLNEVMSLGKRWEGAEENLSDKEG